jgi:hypothetical protein
MRRNIMNDNNASQKRHPGRPQLMSGGRRIAVYLDAKTIDAARKIGKGSVSDGIRTAIRTAIGDETIASQNANDQ